MLCLLFGCGSDEKAEPKALPQSDAGADALSTSDGAPEACVIPESSSSEITLATVKACISTWDSAPQCLDSLFRGYLKTHTTSQALALLQSFQNTDEQVRVGCHPIAHSIGRETFVALGTVDRSLAACDFTCNSGCFHGAMERFLRGPAAGCGSHGHISLQEVRTKVASACDPKLAGALLYQCLHGLGHAVMYFSQYNLDESLGLCDATIDVPSQNACYGGVFMENLVAATPESRDVSPTDYHYPCSKVAAKYKNACYVMQATRMREMRLTTVQIFQACKESGHEATCIESLGRELSVIVTAGQPKSAAQECLMGSGELQQRSCITGVIRTLVSGTQNGRDAFPFCAAFTDVANRAYCFQSSIAYMKTVYGVSKDQVAADCAAYAPQITACTEANAR